MCGIIGIIGESGAAERLVEGLRRLEYRGYDSAGIATLDNGNIRRLRAEGKLVNLENRLKQSPINGTVGIGHTRWATHGAPNERNAHPHATDRVAVVHNGIIENYAALKSELRQNQCRFETDTDTEVIVHLVTHYLKQGKTPQAAANAAFDRLEGAYAVVMIFAGEHDLMIGARHGTPLAVGYGEGEMYVASDSYALAPLTKKICFLEDGDRVAVTRKGAVVYVNDNKPVKREIRITAQSGATLGKGEYPHFMLKEIYEQPTVIGDTLNSFINPATGAVNLPEDIMAALEAAPRVTLIGCGTAFYAGLTAKYWLETLARVPCEADIASEFRYRGAPMPPGGVAIFVSQSGETLDTLEALRYCKKQGQKILSIVNTIESTIERESDYVLRTLAGPEIGVASTKAFTTQLTTLACLALALAERRGVFNAPSQFNPPSQREGVRGRGYGEENISSGDTPHIPTPHPSPLPMGEGIMAELVSALRHLPAQVAETLARDEDIKSIAKDIFKARDMLYLGRGGMYPLALEGALKMKEISYIHAEGYAAGEMKHGPIALIDENTPVIALAPSDFLFDKTASNIQETRARGGKILLISDAAGREKLSDHFEWSITIDDAHPFIAPILYAIPIQLLAYHAAVLKGTDVDQPRNLAKSVTVE